MLKLAGRGHRGAGILKRRGDIEGNKGFVLDNENRTPAEIGHDMGHPAERGQAHHCQSQGDLFEVGRGCPERQSILHARNKRNDWPLKAGAEELGRSRCHAVDGSIKNLGSCRSQATYASLSMP